MDPVCSEASLNVLGIAEKVSQTAECLSQCTFLRSCLLSPKPPSSLAFLQAGQAGGWPVLKTLRVPSYQQSTEQISDERSVTASTHFAPNTSSGAVAPHPSPPTPECGRQYAQIAPLPRPRTVQPGRGSMDTASVSERSARSKGSSGRSPGEKSAGG